MGFLKHFKKDKTYEGFAAFSNDAFKEMPLEEAVAFLLNLYEDGDNRWSAEWVATSAFSLESEDWACEELFATRAHPFTLETEADAEAVFQQFKGYLERYLQHCRYAGILRNKAGIALGFVDGDLELLYQNLGYLRKRPSNYTVISELSADNLSELEEAADRAAERFALSDLTDADTVAKRLQSIAEQILAGKAAPKGYENLSDLAFDLGALFGYTFVKGRNWSWMLLGEAQTQVEPMIVSPDESYCIPALELCYRILHGQNTNPNGENDVTLHLLWEASKKAEVLQRGKKYILLS